MEVYRNLEKNPRENANFFSKIIFLWLFPLFKKGWSESLEKEDLYQVQNHYSSSRLGDLIHKAWTEELEMKRKNGKRSYVRVLFRIFGSTFFLTLILVIIADCIFKIIGPVFLGFLIRHFNNTPGYTLSWGYASALSIVVSNIMAVIFHQFHFFCNQCLGMKIRIASCSIIYRKAIRLSTRALKETTIGQLVNLLSNDVNRFDLSVCFLPFLLIGPLQTLISTAILWNEIGPSCLAAIFLLALYVPFQGFMGKVFSKLRLATALRTDERVRITNEMLSAMKVIKMYAWEHPFRQIVENARKKEIDIIMKANNFRAINMTLFYTSGKIVIFLALLVYVLTGNILTADKVFLTSALLNNIQLTMTLFFPLAISLGSETLASCRRIQTFLEMEERDETYTRNRDNIDNSQDVCVEVKNISARWDSETKEKCLNEISFRVKSGEVVALIGSVGSGKSSLLSAILGELPLEGGSLKVAGKVAYASQEPWIFSGTIRDNITFGKPYNARNYRKVIKSCSLERDFESLSSGDQTVVGEKGMSLSGGQKARISLARAIYFDGDIYLLDDPLSAVDAHVGKHLFEEGIRGLLRNKVVILATHQLQFLSQVHNVLFLDKGIMKAFGSYTDLVQQGVDFSIVTTENKEDFSSFNPLDEDDSHHISSETKLIKATEAWNAVHGSVDELPNRLTGSKSMISSPHIAGSIISLHEDSLYGDKENEQTTVRDEMATESKSKGSVSYKVYFQYFLSGGSLFVLACFMLLNIYFEMAYSGSAYFLSYWTNQEELYGESKMNASKVSSEEIQSNETSNFTNFTLTDQDRYNYAYIYSGITGFLLILSLMRTVLFYHICMTASKTLHNRMFSKVVRTPIRFFEIHPIGQILNRFTKDMGQVDDLLPPSMYDFITIMLSFSGIIGIVLSLNIWILIPTAGLATVFIIFRSIYISSGRDVKRIEGITRSPVFTHLSSTLQGLPTIRAFNAHEMATALFDTHQDFHTSAFYTFLSMTRIFGASIDFLSSIFIAIVTASFMFQREVLGGDVGLGISVAMMLCGMLQWGAKQSAEVENHMTSVERILQYASLKSEVSADVSRVPQKIVWPSQGNIVFKEVYLYYEENKPPVLKGINFHVKPKEKIGIVGRTGAGKSSLLSCLFLLTPPRGDIIIDGVNTKTVPLEILRKSISIIPQDPILFTGSVRYNLDPFNEYSDDNLWTALEEVKLKEYVKEMAKQLDSYISEEGRNLSVGQRQLMCLARAVLKRNKILVLDEATANIDLQTDKFIQETIKENFKDCTVLTIAHRLNTIIDSDRVIVLDSGIIEEFGSPHDLLCDANSRFSHFVQQTGNISALHLKRIAGENFNKKNM